MEIYKHRYFYLVQSFLQNFQGLQKTFKIKNAALQASQTEKLAKVLSKCCVDFKENAL